MLYAQYTHGWVDQIKSGCDRLHDFDIFYLKVYDILFIFIILNVKPIKINH